MQDSFKERIRAHSEHIRKVAELCTTEETTKQALILPLLDILGFSAYDPSRVRAEHFSDFPGVKASERVDYALFALGKPVMFIEAKAHNQNLTNHCPQLSRYFNATPEVAISAITNGQEWRFFTDLVNKNVMDADPFLTVDFDAVSEDDIAQLRRFHHDQFQPDALRALAEESIYLSGFRSAITSMLREVDIDFVRYVAGRAKIERTFTAKFLENVQPLVKQALAQSVSAMVATSLGSASDPEPSQVAPSVNDMSQPEVNKDADEIDPTNPNIITTATERRLLAVVQDILRGHDLHGRDNETYYAINYQGKSNRWLVRYWSDKRQPSVKFGIDLTDAHRSEIQRAGLQIGAGDSIPIEMPEHLYRLVGLLSDSLDYVRDDENFRRTGKRDSELT